MESSISIQSAVPVGQSAEVGDGVTSSKGRRQIEGSGGITPHIKCSQLNMSDIRITLCDNNSVDSI